MSSPRPQTDPPAVPETAAEGPGQANRAAAELQRDASFLQTLLDTLPDLIWLKDDSLEDAADLPAPDVLALEIAEELEAALAEINAIAVSLTGTSE